MKKSLLCISLFFSLWMSFGVKAQNVIPGDSLVFGPMFSPVYENKVRVWVVTKANTGSGEALSLSMTASQAPSAELTGTVFNSDDRLGYHLRSYEFSNLIEGDTYTASLLVNGAASARISSITNGQNILDDFEFLAGGCGRIYDTSRCIDIPESQTHINGNPEMFNHMANEGSDLMVWLGDATYLLGLQHANGQCPDGVDDWANKDMAFDRYMFYRQFHDSLTMAMPQLSITDNHDTGPNEFDKTMPTLGEMREIFMDWWPNPEYLSTVEGQGLHSSYVYKDVEFFLTDNRSYRDGTADHFGDEQLEWLKQELLNSTATFKVIINGTPTFRPIGGRNFSVSNQADEFLQFIQNNNINGVLSFCADIHDQRFMVREGDTKYPLYDIMSGNINSDIGGNGEAGNYSINYSASNDLLTGVKHGYVRTNVFGNDGDRRMKIEYVGFDGQTFFEETIHEDMLTSQNADAHNVSLAFDNNITDASVYTHNAQATGYTFGVDKDGNANSTLVLDANSSFTIPTNNALAFQNKAYSLSFWFNPTDLPNNGSVIVSNASNGNGVTFGISNDGNLTYQDHATGITHESNYSVLTNSWSYITWKYDNVRRKLALYYNGFLIQTWNNVISTTASTADFSIGNNFEGKPFIGSIDAVNLYSRLISDTDILEEADVESNRGDMLKLSGGQQTWIPSDLVNPVLEGNHTIEFWAKLNSDPGTNATIFSTHGRVNNNTTGISLEFPDSNQMNVVYGNNTSGWNTISNQGESWTVGEWNHVAITASAGGMVTYYLNGALVSEMTYGGYVTNTFGLGLGYSFNYNSNSINAEMDEFRLWDKALTAEEVRATMHHPLQGDEMDLAIYYDFAPSETGTTVISEGSIVYEMDITTAELTSATSPVGNIAVDYQDKVSGKWSQNNTINNYGLSLPESISLFTSNIIVGKHEDATLAEVPDMPEVFYLLGGWKLDPLNTPFASVKFNLLETLGTASDSIAAIAGNYYLLKQDEISSEFSIVDEGSFDGTNVSFYNANIEEAIYYLAWEEGEFVPGRGGALTLLDGHDVTIQSAPVETVLTNGHTMEFWINLTEAASGNDKTIVSNHGRVNNLTTGLTLELGSNNVISAVYGNNTSGWTTVNTGEGLQLGEWNHVAVTATPGGELKIFLNGQLKGVTGYSAYAPNNNWNFKFGTSQNYGGELNYIMDEFRMWSSARTQEAIVADMHRILEDQDVTLNYYFTFDQEDNGILTNNGVNSSEEIVYSNASILDASSPVAESVLDFEDTVAASWSFTSEVAGGMYVDNTISSFLENIVFGRDSDNSILELPNAVEEDTYYIKGGWNLNVMNMTSADLAVELSSIFENVDMVNATVAQYLLIKGDPQVAYEVVASGAIANNGNVVFDDVVLSNGNYYVAYQVDTAAAIADQGGAIELPGSQEVYVPKEGINAALSGEFTIELWGRLNAPAGNNTKLWGFSHYGGGEFGIEMEFLSNQTIQGTRGSTGGWQQLNSDHVWNVGEWNHVAMTFVPNGSFKMYVNGELTGVIENAGTFRTSSYDLALGKNVFNNSPTNSSIDEFRIWTKAKTKEEIKADMYQTLMATDADLAYNYTFNQDDSGYLINSGGTNVEVAYSNASIIPATAPVRVMEAPYNAEVTGSWSVVNDSANGLYYGETIADYNSNIVVGKESGDEILPILGNVATDTLYLNSRWKIDPLFISSGSVKVDVSKVFDNLNLVELIANEYFLLSGDPATALDIVASGLKENNIITFDAVEFDEAPLYLAWKNINEYPMGDFPIAAGGLWKYNDTGVDLGTEWQTNAYDDSSWSFGNAILGYGDGVESTTLNFGTDASNKYPTYYMRHIFNVEDASAIGNLLFNVNFDDGVVVYVNGTEALRLNMPEGNITYDMHAAGEVSGDAENAWTEVQTANLLQDGENVIAVELHQNNGTSSDVRFNMEVNYELPALEVTNYPVSKDEQWYYLDQGTDLGTDWLATDYDVNPWERGMAPFGYGDPVNTTVSFGPDAGNKYITTYYTKDINVTLSELTDLVEFGLRRDDGAVVYVNGTEVFRNNLPIGPVDYLTQATSAVDGINENIYHISTVPKAAFVEGVNRIAVEIHQANTTSSDTRFDLYIKNTQDLAIDCTEDHIGCLTSITPTSQTGNMIIASEYDFQVIMKEGDPYTTGGGNMPGTNDFTAYVAIGGSSELGYLAVNHENTPGGVSMLGIHFNTETKLWEVDNSQAVDMYNDALVTTARNCSGGITPWGTVVSAEETTNSGDANGDGYQDVGWFVEIDPATASVMDYGSGQEKLWAMGRMNHENVVISDDGTTAYYGEDGGTNCVYKYVMDTPGNLSAGTVYVLKMDLPLSGNDPSSSTGIWIEVPNDTQSDRNNLSSIAANLGGTAFNGTEDVEIDPITGQIYFAAKGLNRVYRFTDHENTVSAFETFVGGMNYSITSNNGTQSEPWSDGNDNLTFDDKGNLWVLQDGGKNYIWIVRPDHTQSTPNVELFASMPSGSEPTGLTFTPDFKYGFFSVQHPSGGNSPQEDATGNEITFNASTTIVFALEENLGDSTLGMELPSVAVGPRLYPNPTNGKVTLDFGRSIVGQELSIEVHDILARRLMTFNNMQPDGQSVSLDLSSLKGESQIILLSVKLEGQTYQFKVLIK